MINRVPWDRVNWTTTIFLTGTLLVALIGTPLYLIHYGLDWFQVAMFLAMCVLTNMSITLGYHRLFAHKAFQAKWPVKLWTLIFGACTFQNSALDWACDHREHHKHVDKPEDPYDITKGFFWAHIGWLFFKDSLNKSSDHQNVADLRKDKLIMWQHKWTHWIAVVVGLVGPTVIGYFWNGAVGALGGFLIAGVTRVVVCQHCTFFINSFCHMIGSRPYDSRTSARDSMLLAMFTFGEGYHNYHHTFQHDYRNGVKPWEFDPTKWAIWLMEKIGLTSNLRRVAPEKILLAEMKEAQNRALAKMESLSENAGAISCQRWQSAFATLQELSHKVSENYAELEVAVGNRVKLSREKLDEWKREMQEYLAHMDEMHPAMA